MKLAAGLLPLLLVAGCKTVTRDPFLAAEGALYRNDLLRALQAYDAVPVSHPRYPDARAAAVEVELRIRRCHEWMLEALILRGEWRDRQALQAFRRASELWPAQPNLPKWIAATERRLKLFAARQVEHGPDDLPAAPVIEVGEVSQVAPVPIEPAATRKRVDAPSAGRQVAKPEPCEPPPVTSPVATETERADPSLASEAMPPASVPDQEEPVAVAGDDPVTATQPGGDGESVEHEAEPVPPDVQVSDAPETESQPADDAGLSPRLVAEDPVALGLVAVEHRLGRGQLAAAVRDLNEMHRRYQKDRRVVHRLVRLLQQRALVHYGRGELSAAIADWQRMLELDPGNAQAEQAIGRARAEVAGSSRK